MCPVLLLLGLFFHAEGLLLLLGNRHDDAALADVNFQLRRNATALDALLNTSRIEDILNITSNGTPLCPVVSHRCLRLAAFVLAASLPCFLRMLLQIRPLHVDSVLAHHGIASSIAPRRSGRANPQLSLTGLAVAPNCSLAIQVRSHQSREDFRADTTRFVGCR